MLVTLIGLPCLSVRNVPLDVILAAECPLPSPYIYMLLTMLMTIIAWKTSDARQNSLLELRKMVEDFTTAHSGVVQPPSFQSFHCSNTLRDCKYLELISFYVPAHEVNKRAFEHAYWNFT